MLKTPDHFELWADLAVQNRHLRRNNWFHWAVHLLLVVALLGMNFRPLLAVRVDQLGRAELAQAANGDSAPGPEEALHVSRLVSTYLLEVTSGSVGRDLGKAMALMTADFQKAYGASVRGDPTLPLIEKGNVRTSLEFDDRAVEVKAERGPGGKVRRYFVTMHARLDVHRADVLTAPLLSREALVRVTLLVVPRTPRTLNGLLVDFFQKDLLEPRADLRVSAGVAPLPVSPALSR